MYEKGRRTDEPGQWVNRAITESVGRADELSLKRFLCRKSAGTVVTKKE